MPDSAIPSKPNVSPGRPPVAPRADRYGPASTPRPFASIHAGWIALGLAVLTLASFAPVFSARFCNIDDDIYVTDNPHIRGGLTAQAVSWAFTHRVEYLYHPLSIISFMIDYNLFADESGVLDAAWCHAENLVIHTLSALLLFNTLRFMTADLWRSAAVAAIFSIHPLRVESVAWIAERKDVLAVFFGLAAMAAYAYSARRVSWLSYLFFQAMVLLLLALSLLSKPLLITFPALLLLLDFWPLRRFGRRRWTWAGLLIEKIPLGIVCLASILTTMPRMAKTLPLPSFVASAISALVDVNAPSVELPTADPYATLPARLSNAAMTYARCIGKTLFPFDLCVWYPDVAWPAWEAMACAGLLMGITIYVLLQGRPWLKVGWGWYLIALLPVSGVIRIALYSMADRYTYMPMIGLLIAGVWSVPTTFVLDASRRRFVVRLAAGLLLALATVTFVQARTWRDSFTLWRHCLAVTRDNWKAHGKLAQSFLEVNDFARARDELQIAETLRPQSALFHFNRGFACMALGDAPGAMAEYRTTLELNPNAVPALNTLGALLANHGELAQAVRLHERAAEIEPGNHDVRVNLAIDFEEMHQTAKAIEQYALAVQLKPTDRESQQNLMRLRTGSGGPSDVRP